MKYPMLCNWISFQKNDDHYVLSDFVNDLYYTVDEQYISFLKKLDGRTNPYTIDKSLTHSEVDFLLEELDKNDLLRNSRILALSWEMVLLTIWIPKKNKNDYKKLMKFIDNMISVSWLPVLIIGFLVFRSQGDEMNLDLYHPIISYILALIFNVFFHELAHAVSGIANHGEVYEIGIGLKYVFLPLGYTIIKDDHCSTNEKIKIMSAGIKINVFITGLFCILACKMYNFSGICFMIGICGLIIAFLNLLFLEGLDGLRLLLLYLGIDDKNFFQKAKHVVFKKEMRTRLFQMGLIGYIIFYVSLTLLVIQIGIPVLMILNIIGLFI